MNQAQALQILGFYRRASTLLIQLSQTLGAEPDSITKAVELRSLGDALQLVGNLEQSREALQNSLSIAQRLQSPQDVSAAMVSLGNLARSQKDTKSAIALYQQAATVASSPIAKVEAQINQFSLLVNTEQRSAAQKLDPQIKAQLANLPPNQASIYARINFAQSLIQLKTEKKGSTPQDIAYSSSLTDSAQLLATAVQQSRDLKDRRAEAYALGSLGSVYEQTKQWSNARDLTQQVLLVAQTVHAPDVTYRWQWQMGRLLKQQGDIPGAIAAYDSAVETLQSLRSDLVGVNRDVQFSFRESVEPVYRESVELLLQSQGTGASEQNLNKARQRIEALQLAELDNFFREACLNAKPVLLDQIVDQNNPTTAIIYPIILPDHLQVIVKIPKQPLRHHVVPRSQKEIKEHLIGFRRDLLEPDTTNEAKQKAREIYNWLIKPIESELEQSGVNTLVFVLDGALRSVPMAALYDGNHYLVEKYAVSLSLGLQLLQPKPLTAESLRVLAAGLVQPPPNYLRFPPLPDIQTEFNLIAKAGVLTQQLLNQAFTSKALEEKVNSTPFMWFIWQLMGNLVSRPKIRSFWPQMGPST